MEVKKPNKNREMRIFRWTRRCAVLCGSRRLRAGRIVLGGCLCAVPSSRIWSYRQLKIGRTTDTNYCFLSKSRRPCS